MGKWINQFLEEEAQYRPDKTDRFKMDASMSVLSVPLQGVLDENLDNIPETRPDKTDRFEIDVNMSVLSVPSQGLLNENLGNIPETRPDKTDRFEIDANMSVLSVLPQGVLDENLENTPNTGTDITDKCLSPSGLSVTSVPSLLPIGNDSLFDTLEERLAIAEYDGHRTPSQAQRIAYQDAFIAVLNTLPQETIQNGQNEDWLALRIKLSKEWLVSQGISQPD